jgi:hypothetical protein
VGTPGTLRGSRRLCIGAHLRDASEMEVMRIAVRAAHPQVETMKLFTSNSSNFPAHNPVLHAVRFGALLVSGVAASTVVLYALMF